MPLPSIPSGNVASATASTGFNVANSCRFNDADSAILTRTLGTPTNVDKWTFSAWIKWEGFGGDTKIFSAYVDGSNFGHIQFTGYTLSYNGTPSAGTLTTSRVFRDVSAWYNIQVIYDSGNSTEGDRIQIWVNGVRETSFSTETYPSQNQDGVFNSGQPHGVGGRADSSQFWGGYMAEVVFCDGQAYDASNFGEFDEDSPTIWKPKDVSGLTFGNNGFYLDFEASDNLGNDANGGTDWSEANLAAADQASDTPTNNFCVMNPLDNFKNAATFSEGNCKLVTASSPYFYNTGTFGLSNGKWYYECKVASSAPSDYNIIGIAGEIGAGTAGDAELGGTGTYGYGYHGNDGKYISDVPTGGGAAYAYGATYSTSTIGVYIDLDNNKLYFTKDGTLQNSGTGISIGTSPPHGVFFPAGGEQSTGGSATLEFNFGGCPAFAISSGNTDGDYGNFEYSTTITGDGASKTFKAICTKNLAEYG